jgi:hypothetical protein
MTEFAGVGQPEAGSRRFFSDSYFALYVFYEEPRRRRGWRFLKRARSYGEKSGFQLFYGKDTQSAIVYYARTDAIYHTRVASDQRRGEYAMADVFAGDPGPVQREIVELFRERSADLPGDIREYVLEVLERKHDDTSRPVPL